jgi:hypothetical protein
MASARRSSERGSLRRDRDERGAFRSETRREEREREREREREERMMGFEPTTFCMASRRSSQLSYIRAEAKV